MNIKPLTLGHFREIKNLKPGMDKSSSSKTDGIFTQQVSTGL